MDIKALQHPDALKAVLGQEHTKLQVKAALLTGRNMIIVGPPGVGKTTIAREVAKLLPEKDVLDCEFNCDPSNPMCPACKTGSPKTIKTKGEDRFVRVQGSPDLTVEDLLGDIDPIKALKFGPMSSEAFTPGKIFRANGGVLFFDEVNRCPERLQNALLQVLQEKKATIGSYKVDFPASFILIATMNPEDGSTERLSDVFVDRFDVVEMTYPSSLEIERDVVKREGQDLGASFPDGLLNCALQFVRTLRAHRDVEKKPSVRASLGLYERAQAHALLDNRKEVTQEDLSEAIQSVLTYRIRLKPSVRYKKTVQEFLTEQFSVFAKTYEREHGGGG